MNNFSMTWTIEGKGGKKNIPDWDDVQNILNSLQNSYGTITLDISDNEVGAQMLQLRTESGKYLIMLGEIVDDDYEVRTYHSSENTSDTVSILGDFWSKKQLTNDFSFVLKVFCEFFSTQNVSKESLT